MTWEDLLIGGIYTTSDNYIIIPLEVYNKFIYYLVLDNDQSLHTRNEIIANIEHTSQLNICQNFLSIKSYEIDGYLGTISDSMLNNLNDLLKKKSWYRKVYYQQII